MNTLLQKAKAYDHKGKFKNNFTSEDVDMALAWLREEISNAQYNHAYGRPAHDSSRLYRAGNVLRWALKQGLIKVTKK